MKLMCGDGQPLSLNALLFSLDILGLVSTLRALLPWRDSPAPYVLTQVLVFAHVAFVLLSLGFALARSILRPLRMGAGGMLAILLQAGKKTIGERLQYHLARMGVGIGSQAINSQHQKACQLFWLG